MLTRTTSTIDSISPEFPPQADIITRPKPTTVQKTTRSKSLVPVTTALLVGAYRPVGDTPRNVF